MKLSCSSASPSTSASSGAYAIVQTGERRLYGNILLKKGIIRPDVRSEPDFDPKSPSISGRSEPLVRLPTELRSDPMKLLRVGAPGLEKPAILHSDGTYRDLSSIVPDTARPRASAPEGLSRIAAADPATACPCSTRSSRIGPCVGSVGKFICIGLNYADHAAETGAADAGGADPVHEGDQRHHRPQRRCRSSPRTP